MLLHVKLFFVSISYHVYHLSCIPLSTHHPSIPPSVHPSIHPPVWVLASPRCHVCSLCRGSPKISTFSTQPKTRDLEGTGTGREKPRCSFFQNTVRFPLGDGDVRKVNGQTLQNASSFCSKCDFSSSPFSPGQVTPSLSESCVT